MPPPPLSRFSATLPCLILALQFAPCLRVPASPHPPISPYRPLASPPRRPNSSIPHFLTFSTPIPSKTLELMLRVYNQLRARHICKDGLCGASAAMVAQAPREA